MRLNSFRKIGKPRKRGRNFYKRYKKKIRMQKRSGRDSWIKLRRRQIS